MEDLKPSADLTDQTFNNLESLLDSIRKELYQVKQSFYSQCFGSWFFFPDPDQTFFSESGHGSAKNPDPIRKNPDS